MIRQFLLDLIKTFFTIHTEDVWSTKADTEIQIIGANRSWALEVSVDRRDVPGGFRRRLLNQ
jgi:hypothetical protein